MLEQALRLISAVVVGALISFTVCGQRYPIKLDRHEKAGQTYHLVAWSFDKTAADATVSDQILKKSEDVVTVELSADVEKANNTNQGQTWPCTPGILAH